MSLILATMTTGVAHASSFVVLEAMTEPVGPSMVMLGAPAAAPVAQSEVRTPDPAPSPSIIALGEPLPAVTYEKVAAIKAEPEKPRRRATTPMVMRGGIFGDAFPTASTGSASPALPEPEPAEAPSPASAAQPRSDETAEVPPEPVEAPRSPELVER